MTRIPTIGSVCTGYAGLDHSVQEVFGGRLAWVADMDSGPSKLLAARFPGVPNLGDITQIDWSAVEPVDIFAGGFPCTDLSQAGKRAGLADGTRSGIWTYLAKAIAVMRPSLVAVENVGGICSAKTDSEFQYCPWCLGDIDAELVVRALGRVQGDLARIGFDAEWTSVRASEAGAPHIRKRVFILAWPRS